MNLTKLKILFMFVLFLTATRVAQAIPGYHINDDASAKRAVKEFAEDSYKFGACVYQAELDKNLWRLTLAAHDYLLKKPDSPQGECSFASAYWRLQQVRSQETISPDVVKQLDAMFEEAARDTKEAANKLPNSAAAHLNYGQYLLLHVMGKEKVPTMLAEFKKAVALQPKVGEFHRWLAEGYAGSGDYSRKTMEAILSEGKQAVELDPRQANAWFLMAVACASPAKADYKNSQRYLDTYLKLRPEGNIGVPNMQKFLKEKLGK